MTAVSKSEKDLEKNEFKPEEMSQFEDVPSIPFQLNFDLPVKKVICGDFFSGLLTNEG